jgi:hypothetical protein
MSFTPRLHLVRTHIITVRCSVITASLSFILSNYPHIITAKIVLYYSDIITVKHIIWRSKSRFCLGTGTTIWQELNSFLSESESVQVFNPLFISVLWLEIIIISGDGLDPINWFNSCHIVVPVPRQNLD